MPYPARPVPQVTTPTPFSTDNSPSAISRFIVYQPEEQMSQADRDLVAKSLRAIRDAAAFVGIDFAQGNWSYRQLECQALPSHLLLLYKQENGAGGASLFSAAIPRAGKGHVRVIPVERRGFVLYSPAPVNAFAMAEFNRMRVEEPAGPPADWLSTSMCYAALTEPNLEVSVAPLAASGANLASPFPPTLEVGVEGDSTVRFVNVAPAQPMQWALTYDAKGQLIKVMRFPAPAYAARIVSESATKP